MNTTLLLNNIKKHIDLTPKEEKLLISKLIRRTYLKGQYIVQQGDICTLKSYILKGCIKTFYRSNSGEEHVTQLLVEDWWATDAGSYFSQTPADLNLQCLENTTVLQFTFDKMEELYDEIPKLNRFFRIIIENAMVASQKRVLCNLSLNARERYLRLIKSRPDLEQRVPQYLIASYIGISKEFLSKLKKKIKNEQLNYVNLD